MGKENIYYNKLGNYREFNLEYELSKMKRLHDRLVLMPNNKEKFLLYRNYMMYYFLLVDLCGKDNFPFEPFDFEWQIVDSKYIMYSYAGSKQLINSVEYINRLFKDAREINEQYGMIRYFNIKRKIDPKTGQLLLQDFFNGMSENIKKVFMEVVNGNINFVPDDGSSAYDIKYFDSPKIKCDKKLNEYDAYWTIAHEVGHCYYYDIMSGRKCMVNLDDEVPSIFMEIIFNMYVDKQLYNQEYGMTSLFNRQSWFACLLALNNIFLTTGENFLLTDELMTGEMNVNKLTENDKIILENFHYDMEGLLSETVVKDEVRVVGFKYTISNLLAIYFADIYCQDKKEGLRLLRDYMMLPPNVTLEEKLEMYEITGESYKKMIRRVHDYGKSKHLL